MIGEFNRREVLQLTALGSGAFLLCPINAFAQTASSKRAYSSNSRNSRFRPSRTGEVSSNLSIHSNDNDPGNYTGILLDIVSCATSGVTIYFGAITLNPYAAAAGTLGVNRCLFSVINHLTGNSEVNQYSDVISLGGSMGAVFTVLSNDQTNLVRNVQLGSAAESMISGFTGLDSKIDAIYFSSRAESLSGATTILKYLPEREDSKELPQPTRTGDDRVNSYDRPSGSLNGSGSNGGHGGKNGHSGNTSGAAGGSSLNIGGGSLTSYRASDGGVISVQPMPTINAGDSVNTPGGTEGDTDEGDYE
jgi:hypothetical protein